jgi:hypothetical protein
MFGDFSPAAKIVRGLGDARWDAMEATSRMGRISLAENA